MKKSIYMVMIYLHIIMFIFIYVIYKSFLNIGIVLYNSLINILKKNISQLIINLINNIRDMINNLRKIIIHLYLKIFENDHTIGSNEQLIYLKISFKNFI